MAKFFLSAFADEASDTLEGQIAALKRNGIRCIEPRSINGPLIEKSDEELKEIRRAFDEAGISVPSFGSPIGKFDIKKDFEEHLKTFRRALEICRILGADKMRMFSFFVPQEELKEHREEVFRRLSVMVKEAKEAGVKLCHENESEIYGQNPAELVDLYGNVPGICGIFDGANLVRQKQDPVAGFEATVPVLEYIHVKDARLSDGAMVPVGEGDAKYREILQRVDKMTDRTVQLTMEPHLFEFAAYKNIDRLEMKNAHTYENSDVAFDAAIVAMKNLLKSIGFAEGENGIWKK